MTVRNISDAVYPIVVVMAVFGLSSVFAKKQSRTRRLKIFTVLKVLNIVYLTVLSCLIYYAVRKFRDKHLQVSYASGVSKIGIIFNILAQSLLIYFIYVINIAKSPKMLSVIEDVTKIDKMFENLCQTLNYHRHFVYEVSVISIGFIAIFGKAVFSQIYISRNIISGDNDIHFLIFFPSLISYLVQSNFVLLVSLVHDRLILVNRLLRNLTEKHHQKPLKIKLTRDYQRTLKTIEILMDIHDCLIDLGNKINDFFKLQILCCLGAQFLIVVFTVFYLYYESLVLKNRINALIWLMWAIWTTLEIFLVTITCHLTCKESRNAGVAIHKVLITEDDPFIRKKLMTFSQQVLHQPLQFAACGLFPIDATLIFTIAGAATTYLLIMLQFQEGIEAHCSNVTLHKNNIEGWAY